MGTWLLCTDNVPSLSWCEIRWGPSPERWCFGDARVGERELGSTRVEIHHRRVVARKSLGAIGCGKGRGSDALLAKKVNARTDFWVARALECDDDGVRWLPSVGLLLRVALERGALFDHVASALKVHRWVVDADGFLVRRRRGRCSQSRRPVVLPSSLHLAHSLYQPREHFSLLR